MSDKNAYFEMMLFRTRQKFKKKMPSENGYSKAESLS